MGNAFRPQPGPALYPPNQTPFVEDITEAGILVSFGIIAFSFVLIIPGIRGWEVTQKIYSVTAIKMSEPPVLEEQYINIIASNNTPTCDVY